MNASNSCAINLPEMAFLSRYRPETDGCSRWMPPDRWYPPKLTKKPLAAALQAKRICLACTTRRAVLRSGGAFSRSQEDAPHHPANAVRQKAPIPRGSTLARGGVWFRAYFRSLWECRHAHATRPRLCRPRVGGDDPANAVLRRRLQPRRADDAALPGRLPAAVLRFHGCDHHRIGGGQGSAAGQR